MFSPINERLIALHGDLTLVEYDLGNIFVGDGAATLDTGIYMVKSILNTGTGLPEAAPGSGGDNLKPGDFLFSNGGIAPETGEDLIPLKEEQICFLTSAVPSFTRPQIDVTTICDKPFLSFKAGPVTASFTITGINRTIGQTTAGGLLNNFVDIVEQDGEDTATHFSATDKTLMLHLFFNDNKVNGDYVHMYMPVILTSNTPGSAGSTSDAQVLNIAAAKTAQSIEGVDVQGGFYRWDERAKAAIDASRE